MLTTAAPPKAAPVLRMRGIGLRLCIGPNAFGNAIGSSLAESNWGGSQQTEVLYSAEEQAQDFTRENARFERQAAANASDTASLTPAQQQSMAMGYGPLTPEAAARAVAVQGMEPGEIADGAATRVDKMGQPLNGRSNYNAFTQFGKIMSGVGNDSLGTTAGKLLDWATYTVPDADQRAAEIGARYGNDPRFAQIDQMRESPLGAIGWGAARLSGASPAAQQMWLDIGTSADGLAMSGAALAGRSPAFTGARTMPELVGEPRLFERYDTTRVSVEREMFRTPNDELSAVISRDTGNELSRQLVPGTGGNLTPEMQRSMLGNTFTHFHPEGGNFSPSDILTGLANGAAEVRAVMPGRSVSLNFENAPEGLIGNPANAYEFMKNEGRPINSAVNTATQAGTLSGTNAIERSDYRIKVFVERNPWVKYTETKTGH